MNNWHYNYFSLLVMELRNLEIDSKLYEMFTGAERQRWLGINLETIVNPLCGMIHLREKVMPISVMTMKKTSRLLRLTEDTQTYSQIQKTGTTISSQTDNFNMAEKTSEGGKLNTRVVSKVEETIWKCDLCEAQFLTVGKLNLHTKNFHEKEIQDEFICECGSKFKDRKGLRSHQRRKEKKNDSGAFVCQNCKKELQTKRGYDMHVQKCNEITVSKPTWTCKVCNKVYKTLKGYENHITCHDVGTMDKSLSRLSL